MENLKQKVRNSITQDVLRAFNQLNATTTTDESPPIPPIDPTKSKDLDIVTRDNDTSGYGSHDDPSTLNNRVSSKVTFENLITQNSIPSSPKTKDQSVMAQMDHKGRSNNTTSTTTTTLTSEQTQDGNESKNGRMPLTSEGTITSGSTSAKSSVKELVGNQKPPNHRKSKSQNRARKALRTITFILGIHPLVHHSSFILFFF